MRFVLSYENRQGVLMRVLGEVVRRGIVFKRVQASSAIIKLTIDCTPVQALQLLRAWRGIIDVISAEKI